MRLKLPVISILIILSIAISSIHISQAISLNKGVSDNSMYIDYAEKGDYQVVTRLQLKNHKVQVLLHTKLSSYPSSAVIENKSLIFYIERIKNKTVLLEHNLITNKTKSITNKFRYILNLKYNRMKHLLYMVAILDRTDRNYHLVTYNLRSKHIKVWNKDNKDQSMVDFSVSPNTHQLILVVKSIKEEFNLIDQANQKGVPPAPPTHTFLLYNEDGKRKKIVRVKKWVKNVSLSPDGKKILISYKDGIAPGYPNKISQLDIRSKRLKLLFTDKHEKDHIRQPLFNKSGKGFYFLVFTENPAKGAIKYYDFQSGAVYSVWSKSDINPVHIYWGN